MSDDDFERRMLAAARRDALYVKAVPLRAAQLDPGPDPGVIQKPPPSVRLAPECRSVTISDDGFADDVVTVRCACGTASSGTVRLGVRCSGCRVALVVPD